MPEARIKRVEHFGTEYGGWWVAPDLLPANGIAIDCGVGTDTSFCERLRDKYPGIRFVGVDHTDEAAEYAKQRGCYDEFIQAAIVGDERLNTQMFKNAKGGSESVLPDHNFVGKDSYIVPCVRLAQLVSFHKPCLVKLDIEGGEYYCYKDCFGVQQVCLEVHHRMLTTKTEQDTDRMIADFTAHGYEVVHRTERDEFLLVLK